MARLPRLSVAGLAHHLLQRGHNRQPVFLDDEDRAAFLALLRDLAAMERVAVHGYALLDSEVHLLVTPAGAEGLSRMMQALGRRHGARFNRRHGRAGTLWSGRFRASVVDPDGWVARCLCFIETEAARSGAAGGVDRFAWSSALHHLGERRDTLITEHLAYWSLGNTPFEREGAWRATLERSLTSSEIAAIRSAVERGVPLGSQSFRRGLAERLDRPLEPRAVGRPRRINLSPKNSERR
jgi:putative transposase